MKDYNFLKESPWFIFMNHGYSPISKSLDANNILANSASLYLNLLDNVITKDKILLDVGCGRGGGVKTYRDIFHFNKIYACDYNENFIDFCKSTHDKIEFKVCSATQLIDEYETNTFDLITNVESSHCYFDKGTEEDFEIKYPKHDGFLIEHVFGLNRFFDGVAHILKPDGTFCYTDAFSEEQLLELEYSTFNKQFSNVIKTDITENVILACEEFLRNDSCIPNGMVKSHMKNVAHQKIKEYRTKQKYIKFICNK